MITRVEDYFSDGCGRCSLFATPACKVNFWREQLLIARSIILECGLVEEAKWGSPCYTLEGKNILMLSALKDCVIISFFKGALLEDPIGLLVKPGENSQAARMLKFTNSHELSDKKDQIIAFIAQAIDIEKQGKKVEFKKELDPLPLELLDKFEEYPDLEKAFFKLTPGRQRGYILFFSQPKQSQTRINRIEKYLDKILQGEGMHD
jgi:uncharacterized protein YdeI (YjbR/CyaY-like superfamily)